MREAKQQAGITGQAAQEHFVLHKFAFIFISSALFFTGGG